MPRFALIGYGAITEELAGCIERCGELEMLLAVLVRPQRLAEARGKAAGRLWIFSSAVAGIDGSLAARTAGLNEVTYTSRPRETRRPRS